MYVCVCACVRVYVHMYLALEGDSEGVLARAVEKWGKFRIRLAYKRLVFDAHSDEGTGTVLVRPRAAGESEGWGVMGDGGGGG